jgi:hypothetical protein
MRVKFVVTPKGVHSSGVVVDMISNVVEPKANSQLGEAIENEETFDLPSGQYVYRFTSYGPPSQQDFTIKIVDVSTGKTLDGPDSRTSPRVMDTFKFSI